MKRKQLFLLACMAAIIIPPSVSVAQNGNLFITNYEIEKVLDKQVYSICEDSYMGMLFATRKGILYFDSENWEVIKTPDIPLVIQKDEHGSKIYVGCRNDIGYIEKQAQGHYLYHSFLADSLNPGDVTGIEQTTSDVYFYSSRGIIQINKIYRNEQNFVLPDSSGYFNGIFKLNKRVYINAWPNGIHDIEDLSLISDEDQEFIGKEEILFGIPFDHHRVLIGTGSNVLYLFDGSRLSEFKTEDQEYLNESFLVGGESINDTSFVVSTILGGCLIINKTNGKTLYTINYRTGLPDDEIFALGFDSNQGIWLSHTYGISRVDPFIPVKNYNTYPGLEGHLFSSTVFNKSLYLSTNTGIYKLDEKKEYLEQEILVKVPVSKPPPVVVEETEPDQEAESLEEMQVQEEGLSKRELRRLQRQGKKEERVDEREQKEKSEVGEAVKEVTQFFSSLVRSEEQLVVTVQQSQREKKALIQKPAFRKKKIYSLQSISHEFVKIEGLNEKSKPLLNYGDRILAGTHAGLYQIIDDKAMQVFPDWYIEFLYLSPVSRKVYVGTLEMVYLINLENDKWVIEKEFDEIREDIYSVYEESDSLVWFGGYQNVYKITSAGDSITDISRYASGTEDFEPIFIKEIQDDILFLQADGIYLLYEDSLIEYQTEELICNEIPENHFSDFELSWLLQNNDWISFGTADSGMIRSNTYLDLFNKVQDVYFDPEGNIWVIHENTLVDKIVASEIPGFNQLFGIHIQNITNEKGFSYTIGDLDISYRDRSLAFNICAPSFQKSQSTEYQYIVENLTNEWSHWSTRSAISFPVIPPGKYTLKVRARNILGQTTLVESIDFSIDSPFWSSWWFITLMALCLIGLILLFIRMRVKKLQRDKKILEHKVKERTAEIERQKNEIAAQQKEIMDSIHYAQRIQNAILPKTQMIKELLPENFILFLPRDIVSGDFYWMKNIGDHVIFAAADCTGHGVPGAFMSMLGVSFLNEIVSKGNKLTASSILEDLRNLVKTTLEQTGKENEQKDGMDIALLIYNKKTRVCQYSGAYNPLYIIRKSELIEVKADRMPIGIYIVDEKKFSNHELKLQKNDCLYVFSDGFADQIGGEKGKKLLTKTMKNFLVEIHTEPMSRQKEILDKRLKEWMGNYQQVDDILMAGLRIT